MAYSAVLPAPRRRRSVVVLTVVATFVVAVLAVSLVVAHVVLGPDPARAERAEQTSVSTSAPGVGDKVRTSFGTVDVDQASMSADGTRIELTLTVANVLDDPFDYHTRQFIVLDRSGTLVDQAEAPSEGVVAPHAALSLQLTYLREDHPGPFVLTALDERTGHTVVIDLDEPACRPVAGACTAP